MSRRRRAGRSRCYKMRDTSKYSIERRAYAATRSFLRALGVRRTPVKKPSRKLKILTNVQTSTVAGISRVMTSFADYISSAVPDVELVRCSVSAMPSAGMSLWEETPGCAKEVRTFSYTGTLPNLGEVLKTSASVDDVSAAFSSLTEAFRLMLIKERPDIVLANGTYIVPLCLVTAAHALHIPIVLYYHGSLTKETEHWKEPKARKILRSMEAAFNKTGIRYVFPSVLIKDFVEQHVLGRKLYQKNAVVLPNPIPEEFFSVTIRSSRRRIGFVGRWTRIKNTAFLERFVEINHKAGTPFDIYVLTDPASRERAGKILHDRVRFVRPRSESAGLASFYSGMSAIICPSHFETYGNVAQEAVASGTPAYVSKNMGVAEIFERVGLDKLIVNFDEPRGVFQRLQDDADLTIPESVRQALQKEVGATIVHKKLLDYISI